MDYSYSYKMAYSVPIFDVVHYGMWRCLFLIFSIIVNLDMPIIKHVCFSGTVCIIQNMNQNRLTLRFITPHYLIIDKKKQNKKKKKTHTHTKKQQKTQSDTNILCCSK